MFFQIFQILVICTGVIGGIIFTLFSLCGISTLWKYKKIKWTGLGLLILGCLGEVYLLLTPGVVLSILEMANKTILSYVFGYGFSVIAGHFFISLVMEETHKDLEKRRFYQRHTAVLGVVERVLYTASLGYKRPEFIALWLTLKTAVHWKAWTQEKPIPGRTIYNVFLIGNGLSIIYGLTGAMLIKWWQQPCWSKVVVAPLALVVGCLILCWWVVYLRASDKRREESSKN